MKTILSTSLLLVCIACMAGSRKDTIYKSYNLKHGYKLLIKRHDSINYSCIVKNGEETEVSEDEADTSMPLEVLGYPYADFDSTFVIAIHIQANPVRIEIIKKSNGGTVMYGASPFYLDTLNSLMMFEGSYRRGGKLILYNFKTGKTELFLAPKDTHCFCCSCWKLAGLTDKEVKIEYLNMKHESVIKTYER
jgi:hypothetical protein